MKTSSAFRNLPIWITSVFVVSSLLSSPSFATLGKHEKSVESDRIALRGQNKRVQHQKYSVQEISAPTGTIREYISGDGVVFAVTWEGVSEPDLSQLLGDYFKEYKSHRGHLSRPSRRAPIKVKSDDIVVEKGGHMRDIHGRAYVPNLIPNGVSQRDIQ